MSEVWDQTVDDGRFRCYVEQDPDNAYRGELIVLLAETGTVIHAESVGIAYGAPFGPDVDDVGAWQDKCITVIDIWIAAND
jgi:hypothetical protein